MSRQEYRRELPTGGQRTRVMRLHGREGPEGSRGQTTVDFGIGAGIFLLTVAYTAGFIPGMLQPFEGGVQEETVAADRVADQLTDGMLGTPSDPGTLDISCTAAFFERSRDDTSCRFSNDRPLSDRVGISDRIQLRVTVITDADNDGRSSTACLVDDGNPNTVGRIGERTTNGVLAANGETLGPCSVPFELGASSPTKSGSVVLARRFVRVGTLDCALIVRAW